LVFLVPANSDSLEESVESRLIRVMVVDHNSLMRDGLALLVRLQKDMQLVCTAATAEETVRMYLEQRPDLTLMDLDMASHAALGAIRKIRAQDPGARIIGLATYERDAAWTEALAAGACQCVAKNELSVSLPDLIRKVAFGRLE
jgi:DNA-binding NarL/FixJ family response regulator